MNKKQLFDLVGDFNNNLYNYRNEPGKAWEILWERYKEIFDDKI